jgi:class 3 adenylate cyclase
MFTDFQAFTQHSQNLTPEKLVKSVDHFFSAFDKIIEKYHLEKIKTIGDAYMCTGGLIRKGPQEPLKVIRAAFEIIDFVEQAQQSDSEDIAHFSIRIGINTGPVVGGVVGTKKFAFDIWGDTVNVAARMESNSVAGKINISENTYQLVRESFECEYRGEIDVKNKGMMKMYFVHGPKESANRHKENTVDKKTAVKA